MALVLVTAGCGRVAFSPLDDAPTGSDPIGPGDAVADGAVDASTPIDAPPMIACADVHLGSALGPSVATGNTAGRGNQYASCSGEGSDVSFGWFAPATGMYRIDLCASEEFWDSVLYVRNGDCNGAQLACSDDACGGAAGLQGRVTVNLTAGQGIVIVVDAAAPAFDGDYQLAITQL